jgi:nucleoside-diphosphate-sugar epimerase
MPKLAAHDVRRELSPLVAPDTLRDFVTARDVTRAFLEAARRSDLERGAVFNIGSGTQTTLREAVAAATDVLGIAAEPRWGTEPPRSRDAAVCVSDPRRARDQLRWTVADDMTTGFTQLAYWLRERCDLWTRCGVAAQS